MRNPSRHRLNFAISVLVLIMALTVVSPNLILEAQPEPVWLSDDNKLAHLRSDDSLAKKIGSMLLIGFRGKSINNENHIVRDIKKYHLGGVILFDYDVPQEQYDRNIENPAQTKQLVTDLQKLTSESLFISIDQEGGKVNRLKKRYGFEKSVSAEYLGTIGNSDTTRYYAKIAAEQLSDLGINMNFAPLLDVNINPDNPVIGNLERSFSDDPTQVIEQAEIFIDQFLKFGIIPVVKHFPGHGSSKKDSHLGVVDVTETWNKMELEPYKALVSQNVLSVVMTAHIFNKNIDSNYPATLSQKTITGLLRDDIGFNGVVISDDMQMKAIRTQYGLEEAIVRSLNAGVDILLFGNNSIYDKNIVPKAVKIIKEAIDSGRLSEATIDKSYKRIQKLRVKLLSTKR
mgnify:FL=1